MAAATQKTTMSESKTTSSTKGDGTKVITTTTTTKEVHNDGGVQMTTYTEESGSGGTTTYSQQSSGGGGVQTISSSGGTQGSSSSSGGGGGKMTTTTVTSETRGSTSTQASGAGQSKPQPMMMQFPPFHIDENDFKAGSITVKAQAPSGKVQSLEIVQDSSGQFTTNFIPSEVGDWLISIMSNNKHIQGSPFQVRVYDGTQVKVFGIKGGTMGQAVSFTVDTTNAGDGKLKVDVTCNDRPIQSQMTQSGRQYTVTFNPDSAGVYAIRVFFAAMEVPGSPFGVTIVDSASITIAGDGLKTNLAGQKATFIVNTGNASLTDTDVTVHITSPKGTPVAAGAISLGGGSYQVEYTPLDIGAYVIELNYAGKPIVGSPFKVDVFGLTNFKMSSVNKKEVMINKTYSFEFDAVNTGSGEPEVIVNEGSVECKVESLGERKYRASFVPKKTGEYSIQVKFYGQEIPGSPLKVVCHDSSKITTTLTDLRSIVNTAVKFDVVTKPYVGEVKAVVTGPGRKQVTCTVKKVDDFTYNLEFLPLELGSYDVAITFEDMPIKDSPFTVPVVNPGGVLVALKNKTIVLGKAVDFTVDTTRAGPGDLSIKVNNASEPIPVSGNLISQGIYGVSFMPETPGQYFIDMSFNSDPLPESPITVVVLDPRKVNIAAGLSPLCRVGQKRTLHVTTNQFGCAELVAKLTPPGHHATPLSVTGSNAEGYDITFTPMDPGPHVIDITYGGVVVPNSPVTIMGFDASKIKVIGVIDGIVSKKSTFLIDLNDSGEGELEVIVMSATGKPIVNEVNPLQPGKLEVSYMPVEGGLHFIEITFNKEPVPGGPFKFKVYDPSRITVRGDGIEHFQANIPAIFFINAPEARISDFEILFKGPPNSRQIQPIITESSGSNIKVEWTARTTGEYQVSINYLGIPIPGSPYLVKVWDASKILVARVAQGQVGVESSFNVEMRDAGDGTVELSIMDPTGQLIPNNVTNKSPGLLRIGYVPQVAGMHVINIEFNSVRIPGCPFKFNVIDPSKVSIRGEGLGLVACRAPASFVITAAQAQLRDIEVKITDPTDMELFTNITEKNGNFRVEYTPTHVGPYNIEASCFGIPLRGSPFVARAWDASRVLLANISMGQVDVKDSFKVIVTEAGEGVVEISITDPSGNLVPNQAIPDQPGVLDVVFTPTTTGSHRGIVTFNKEKIPGSPFNFMVVDKNKVSCRGEGVGFVMVKKMSTFTLNAPLAELKDIDVKIIGPKGIDVPANVTEMGSFNFRVDYTPTVSGDYQVAVKYFNQAIHAVTAKAWDVNKVLVNTMPLGRVDHECVFNVDVREAGEGRLEISIQNPTGQMIENVVSSVSKTPGLFQVSCTPVLSGPHRVTVSFNNEHVNGSPFTLNVCDPKQATASGEGLHVVRCARPATFEIHGPAAVIRDVHVNIKAPNGKEVKPKIRDMTGGIFNVEYTPVVPGEYVISVKYFDESIKDSPFVAVAWNPSAVVVDNIKSGIVGRPNSFHINATDAGPGNLEVMITCHGETVRNTARALGGSGMVEVTYTPEEMEPHSINIKFNGEPVPGSPFTSNVIKGFLAVANGPGLGRVKASVPTKFTVTAKSVGSAADLHVNITAPSGQFVPSNITGSYSSGFNVEYTPVEAGQHTVDIKYADMSIKDSPFHPDVFDPMRVYVSQLPFAVINKAVSFKVDTSLAGPGRVNVTVQGNKSRPHVDINADHDGIYLISFTPTEGIAHNVVVKFNDADVPGSPFKCFVMDQKQLRVKFENIALRPVNKQTTIQLDTTTAPVMPVECTITDPHGQIITTTEQKNGTVHVFQFTPDEVGSYQIMITYGEEPVPGCPFICTTYDTRLVRIIDVTQGANVGQEVGFTVDATDAGPCPVDVNVTSAGTGVPVRHERYMDKHRFIFVAKTPTDYIIDVHFNKESVAGCPFIYQIVNPASNMTVHGGNTTKSVAIGQVVWAVINPPNGQQVNTTDINARATGPISDQLLPVRVTGLPNGNIKVEYTSMTCGPHTLQIDYAGQLIPGSPIVTDIFDPNKIRLEGPRSGETMKPMVIDLCRGDAGAADLTVTIGDPKGHPVAFDVEMTDVGERITYVPVEPGLYKVNVTFGGVNVPGCPIRQEIRANVPVTASGDGLVKGIVDHVCTFTVDSKGQKGELIAQIQGPNGLAKVQIEPDVVSGQFRVNYMPVEVGTYTVNMLFNGREVQGLFHPKIVDPSRVEVIDNWDSWSDPDHVRVKLNQLKTIAFHTAYAGPGKLTATIEAPDCRLKVIPDVLPVAQEGWVVKFVPRVVGDYFIRAYFNEMPITRFPIIASCIPEHIDIIVDLPPVSENGKIETAFVQKSEASEQISGSSEKKSESSEKESGSSSEKKSGSSNQKSAKSVKFVETSGSVENSEGSGGEEVEYKTTVNSDSETHSDGITDEKAEKFTAKPPKKCKKKKAVKTSAKPLPQIIDQTITLTSCDDEPPKATTTKSSQNGQTQQNGMDEQTVNMSVCREPYPPQMGPGGYPINPQALMQHPFMYDPSMGPMTMDPSMGPMMMHPSMGPMMVDPSMGPMMMDPSMGPMMMHPSMGPMMPPGVVQLPNGMGVMAPGMVNGDGVESGIMEIFPLPPWMVPPQQQPQQPPPPQPQPEPKPEEHYPHEVVVCKACKEKENEKKCAHCQQHLEPKEPAPAHPPPAPAPTPPPPPPPKQTTTSMTQTAPIDSEGTQTDPIPEEPKPAESNDDRFVEIYQIMPPVPPPWMAQQPDDVMQQMLPPELFMPPWMMQQPPVMEEPKHKKSKKGREIETQTERPPTPKPPRTPTPSPKPEPEPVVQTVFVPVMPPFMPGMMLDPSMQQMSDSSQSGPDVMILSDSGMFPTQNGMFPPQFQQFNQGMGPSGQQSQQGPDVIVVPDSVFRQQFMGQGSDQGPFEGCTPECMGQPDESTMPQPNGRPNGQPMKPHHHHHHHHHHGPGQQTSKGQQGANNGWVLHSMDQQQAAEFEPDQPTCPCQQESSSCCDQGCTGMQPDGFVLMSVEVPTDPPKKPQHKHHHHHHHHAAGKQTAEVQQLPCPCQQAAQQPKQQQRQQQPQPPKQPQTCPCQHGPLPSNPQDYEEEPSEPQFMDQDNVVLIPLTFEPEFIDSPPDVSFRPAPSHHSALGEPQCPFATLVQQPAVQKPVQQSVQRPGMQDAYPVIMMPDGYPMMPDGYVMMPDGYPMMPDGYPMMPDGYPMMPDGYPMMQDPHQYSMPPFPPGHPIILVQQQPEQAEPEPEPEPEEEPGLSEEERMQELVHLLSTLAQPTHVKHKTPKAIIIEELDDDEEEEEEDEPEPDFEIWRRQTRAPQIPQSLPRPEPPRPEPPRVEPPKPEPPKPAPPVIDASKVVVTGPGLALARCREQSCFVIDGKEAGPGVPSVRMCGLKDDIAVHIEPVDTNLYGCTYVPYTAGAYLLSVLWSDHQIPKSPIKVTVLPCCDPSQVSCIGDGLKQGVLGKEINAVIDARRAGIGELNATCQGPIRPVTCELDDRKDGTFELILKPTEVGTHTLQITFDGQHVPGSPFSLKIAAAPDASKVRVSGEGIKNGLLATFDSKFTVDTRGAGPGQLNVKVRGKKGTFRVDMKRDHTRDRQINCRFNPTEVGEYFVNVLWSGEHAPGSPFHVFIVDTMQELRSIKTGVKPQITHGQFYGTLNSDNGIDFCFPED